MPTERQQVTAAARSYDPAHNPHYIYVDKRKKWIKVKHFYPDYKLQQIVEHISQIKAHFEKKGFTILRQKRGYHANMEGSYIETYIERKANVDIS